MKAIVAVDSNWGIGFEGNLLQMIPEDLKYFRDMTIGNVVVMGRETFESLPGQSPLKDRTNIVLTRNKSFKRDGVIVCHSVEETLKELSKYDTTKVFIIGGATIYQEFGIYCDEFYVTHINNSYKADRHFTLPCKLKYTVQKTHNKYYNGISYYFAIYKRIE